jgi:hypothetical protein
MTYAAIKAILSNMAPQAVRGIVSTTGGSPASELALYLRMINNRIAAQTHKFSWTIRTYTLTLTGATEYDLATLIPDLQLVRLVTGTQVPNGVATYVPDSDLYRRTWGPYAFTIQNKVLKFDTPPLSGTLIIPYHTFYLVKTSGGTYQLDFSADTDVSVVPEEHTNMLIEGAMEFFYRKEKKSQYTNTFMLWDGRIANVNPFTHWLTQAIASDRNINSSLYDFRFIG